MNYLNDPNVRTRNDFVPFPRINFSLYYFEERGFLKPGQVYFKRIRLASYEVA